MKHAQLVQQIEAQKQLRPLVKSPPARLLDLTIRLEGKRAALSNLRDFKLHNTSSANYAEIYEQEVRKKETEIRREIREIRKQIARLSA